MNSARHENRFRAHAVASALLLGLLLPGRAQAPKITVITGEADNVTMNSARLRGVLNPNGCTGARYRFWYGEKMGDIATSETTPEAVAGASTGNQPVEVQVSGLKPGTAYFFRLLAYPPPPAGVSRPPQPDLGEVHSFRTRPGPGPAVALPAPRRPVDLRVEDTSERSVDLSWSASLKDTGPFPLRYFIERRGPDGVFVPVGQVKAAAGTERGGGTQWRDSGILPGTTYHYRVKSAVGMNFSPSSEEVSATTRRLAGGNSARDTRLAPPRLLNVRALSRLQVLLEWSQPLQEDSLLPSLQSFRIEIRDVRGWPPPIVCIVPVESGRRYGRFSHILTNGGLEGNRRYRFRVQAVNATGASEFSSQWIVRIPE